MKAFVAQMGIVCVLLGAALGCRTPQPPPPEFEAAPKEGVYIIGPADRLRIDVWQNDKLALAEVPVRPDGMISVPLLNDVKAAELTTEQLKAEITTKLSEFITSPDVTVVVLRPDSKRVFVLGEVARQGPVPLATNLTVVDVISAAGGLTPFADSGDIRIIRRAADGSELEFAFDYDAYVRGRAPGTNILLQPNDKIVVPK